MECKYKLDYAAYCQFLRINRYIMECKLYGISSITAFRLCELIDTLWNVNEQAHKNAIELAKGINRYIMECKFHIFWNKTKEIPELIDTLWNVNLITCIFIAFDSGINRYIMECKYLIISFHSLLFKRINRYIMECKLRQSENMLCQYN